ncbi:MAG TPA: hypothetical protein PK714_11995, partial [Nitrosomonas sp.]|nr:hypothetical protein [Nitrosomonas sp.]
MKSFSLHLVSSSNTLKACMLLVALISPDTPITYAQNATKPTHLPGVTVTASPFKDRSELDMAQPVSVLQGD